MRKYVKREESQKIIPGSKFKEKLVGDAEIQINILRLR